MISDEQQYPDIQNSRNSRKLVRATITEIRTKGLALTTHSDTWNARLRYTQIFSALLPASTLLLPAFDQCMSRGGFVIHTLSGLGRQHFKVTEGRVLLTVHVHETMS